MNNDYLWDGSGPPDPDVARFERSLGRLRSVPPPLKLPDRAVASTAGNGPPEGGRHMRLRSFVPLLATAATVLLMVGLLMSNVWRDMPGPGTASWDVSALAGRPLVGATAIGATGRLAVGQTLTTDASSRARISVSTIGEVEVDGNTRVRLVATREGHHRLAMTRGTLHAVILAPPGEFVVDTPSAIATDLGCSYTLHVDESGAGLLSVRSGWVAFELNGHESFVPAGASCLTEPREGPGTPRFDDADPELIAALDEVDFGRDARQRAQALRVVLEHARPHDAVTLWHLLARVQATERADVVAALAARVPPPAGVTREAALKLDRQALDQWWDALGLGDTTLWRTWKRPLGVALKPGS